MFARIKHRLIQNHQEQHVSELFLIALLTFFVCGGIFLIPSLFISLRYIGIGLLILYLFSPVLIGGILICIALGRKAASTLTASQWAIPLIVAQFIWFLYLWRPPQYFVHSTGAQILFAAFSMPFCLVPIFVMRGLIRRFKGGILGTRQIKLPSAIVFAWQIALAILRLTALATALALLARHFWLGELAVSFIWQYFVATLLLMWSVLFIRNNKTFYVHLLLVIFLLAVHTTFLSNNKMYKQYYAGHYYTDMKIVHLNVSKRNDKFEETVAAINDKLKYADIINLQEFMPGMQDALPPIVNDRMAFKYIIPRKDGMGSAFYSRTKPDDFKVHYLNNGTTFIFQATYKEYIKEDKTREDLDIFTLHTFAPITPTALKYRNEQLESLANLINESPSKYKAVIGDLNVTPFSPAFKNLLDTADLRYKGYTWKEAGTWPFKAPWSLFSIPIDHILTSKGLYSSDREITSAPGSDHLMLSLRIAGGSQIPAFRIRNGVRTNPQQEFKEFAPEEYEESIEAPKLRIVR